MSNLSDDGPSFGCIFDRHNSKNPEDQANVKRVCQPIPVKLLLQFQESDDENSDDKSTDSKDDIDSDEPVSLSDSTLEDGTDLNKSFQENQGSPSLESQIQNSEITKIPKSSEDNREPKQCNGISEDIRKQNDINKQHFSDQYHIQKIDWSQGTNTENRNFGSRNVSDIHGSRHQEHEHQHESRGINSTGNEPAVSIIQNLPVSSYNVHYANAKLDSAKPIQASDKHWQSRAPPDNQQHVVTISSSASQMATETPLKQASIRPTPVSTRNNFQTPQSKVGMDMSRNSAQTPSTILSQWIPANVMRYETPRYFGMENKGVRRPLGDASAFALETKPRYLQNSQPSKVEETPVRKQLENREDRTAHGHLEKRFAQLELDVNEAKENRHPNLPKDSHEKGKPCNDASGKKYVVIGTSTAVPLYSESRESQNSRIPGECSQEMRQPETNVRRSNEKCGDVQEVKHVVKSCTENSARSESKESQNSSNMNGPQNEVRQMMEKINVQFSSVATGVPKQSKTIVVKGREYLILGVLGHGMSGEVLKVQDLSSSELRAVKCVNLSRMDKESAQGCLDEISTLQKLQAPCVIKMFDYEIKDPMVYVVMEMGDTDLSHLLKTMAQEKQLSLTLILYYWTEMLTAVKHIHDNGVIHSDLKPSNFLLVRGKLKLIDFGIASSVNAEMTSVVKNSTIGTLNYISPEALMDVGENSDTSTHNVKYKISYKSDVWSLGCILYSMVYGHTPFSHIRSQWAKISAITNSKLNISYPAYRAGNVPKETEQNTKEPLPPVLIDVMRKCLQHDPKARPTAAQLLEIQYIPTRQEQLVPVSDLPPSILVKIKHVLNEEEWRQLVQVLERNRRV